MIKQEVTWYLSHVPGVQVLSLDLPLWPHRTALMAASVTSPMCLLGREGSGHLQICVTVSWVCCFSLVLSHLTRSVSLSCLQDVAEDPSSEKHEVPNSGF